MYENALDWEHLPFVHPQSFQSIACEEQGPWGWRAKTTAPSGSPLTIELRLDRECRRWITRTLAGAHEGTEVWTHAFPIAARRTDIVVDFFVPGISADERARVGEGFARTYARLYDEDVAMMCERQRQMDARIDGLRETEAKYVGDLASLTFPLLTELRGLTYRIARLDDAFVAYAARCPHQLGPLGEPADGVVACAWHGYRFDVRSGACLTGQACRLPPAPRVSVRGRGLWLEP